jgi:hypothetical protein
MVLGLYGGLKYYLYTHARDLMRQVQTLAAPMADVQYRGIASSLIHGTLSAARLTITPTGFHDAVTINELRLSAGSLPALFTLGRALNSTQGADRFEVSLEGLAANYDSDFMQAYEARVAQVNARARAGHLVTHCGGTLVFGPKEHRQMGYPELRLNAQAAIDFDRRNTQLSVRMTGEEENAAHVEVAATFGGLRPNLTENYGTKPTLVKFEYAYQDRSYVERAKHYCMETAKVTEAQYIEAVSKQEGAAFAWGWWGLSPGPSLRAAYREFLKKPDEIEIKIQPSEELELTKLRVYTNADDWMVFLNPTVKINGVPVDGVSFSIDEAALAWNLGDTQEKPKTQTAKASAAKSAKTATAPGARKRLVRYEKVERYQKVAINDLPLYNGHLVRLDVHNAFVREGVLLGIKDGVALLDRPVTPGNRVTIQIPLPQIRSAEVRVE